MLLVSVSTVAIVYLLLVFLPLIAAIIMIISGYRKMKKKYGNADETRPRKRPIFKRITFKRK